MEHADRGNHRRSVSESDQNRSGGSSGFSSPTSPTSPGLMSDLNLERSISNPDLAYLRENIIESPMGQGLGTRLQASKSERRSEKLERTLQRVEYLRVDVESWAGIEQLASEANPIRLDVSMMNYDQLIARKKVLAKEALIRGADMKVIRLIEGLGTRMDGLKRLAERREQRSTSTAAGNPTQTIGHIVDEVFQEDQAPGDEGIQVVEPLLTQVEPEREKNPAPRVDKPHQFEIRTPPRISSIGSDSMTASVEKIIQSFNAARRAADLGEEAPPREELVEQIIASIREVGATLGNPTLNTTQSEELVQVTRVGKENSDKLVDHASQLSSMETKCNAIQNTMVRISNSINQIESAVSKVQETQGNSTSRLSNLETKVNLIDSNIKAYIGRKIAPIKEQVSNLRLENLPTQNAQVTPHLQTTIKTTIEKYCTEVGLAEIRKELDELREHNTIEERTVENLREIVVEVRDQVSRNPLSANISRSAHTSTPMPLDPIQSSMECEVIKSNIERSIRQIRQLTATVINMGSDVGLIKKCNKEDTSKVNKYVKACGDDLLKYIKYPDTDPDFCKEVQGILDSADDWVMNVENIYARSEAHAISDSRGDISRLIIFNNNAEKTVFEFIDEADMAMLGWGTSKQRASLLSQHLSEEIKSRTAEFSDNFSRIREWLIKTYGRADRIIGDISAGLKAQSKPSNAIPSTSVDKGERYTYFANICTAIARFDKLAKIPDIQIEELNAVMYCRNTVAGLIDLLPGSDQDQLRRKMTERTLDWDNPQGCATYALFKEYCETERNIVSAFRGMESKSRPKPKSVFISRTEKGGNSDEEDPTGIHTTTYTPPAPWYPPGMRFPCPLVTHNHEMAECKEWLSMSPADRWENTKVRRICYACLRPKSRCNERKCKFYKNVSELITCQGCIEYASSQGWAPFSILMCRKRKHAEVRARYADIKKTLDKYLGQMSSDINESNLKVSANFSWQVHATVQSSTSYLAESLKTDKPLSVQVPCIDTNSGTRVYPEQDLIKLEIDQHAHYLMQILQIGGSQVLTFFDSGANSHLISGEVAETENLEKYSSRPTRITVVGGGSVCSEYGSYKFGLGPDEENKFHELRCIGIEDVTTEFRKYDLTDIIKEYTGTFSKNECNIPLPKYVGGGKVNLLIGIKNTNLVPILIKTLNSGVGVYKSPFKDIFGSRIIFAGPHASFTRGNRGIQEEVSHAVFHINRRQEERLSGVSIPYSIVADKQTGASVYPTPLSRMDYLQLGVEPEQDQEVIESQAEINGVEAHVCRIKGNQVPITRMRELINQDDPGGLISFKCSTCSACVQCRKSPRTTAISLQESREQEVIEKSVSIRRMIQWTTDQDSIPFIHIEGISNIADLLTKKHDLTVEQVSIGSTWQEGDPWMKLEFKNMPLISYDMLSLDKKSQDEVQTECFSEPFLPESQEIKINFVLNNPVFYLAVAGRGWDELMIDPIRFGWQKTLRILNIVLKFRSVLKHRTCHKYSVQECEICTPVKIPDPRNNHQESKNTLFRFESKRLSKSLGKKQLEKFTWNQGILYYQSRISEENPFKFKDLDMVPFIDAHVVKPYLHVVQKDYPVLYSLVILGPGIRVKFNSKSTITNQKLEIMYYMYYKVYYCRSRTTEKIEEMRKTVEERAALARSAAPQGSSDLLVRQPQVVTWGSKMAVNKESLVSIFVGYKPVIKYLRKIMVNGLQDPQLGPKSAFLPEGAPLLEYLAVYQERMDAWKYPTREEVNLFERGRGLSMKTLEEVEVRVIGAGKTSPERIKETVEWFWDRWLYTQEKYPTQVVTLDNYEYEGKKRTESDKEFDAQMRGETQESDVILETVFNEDLE